MDKTHDKALRSSAMQRLCADGAPELAEALLGPTHMSVRRTGSGELILVITSTGENVDALRGHTRSETGSEMPGLLDRAVEGTLRAWPDKVVFIVVPPDDLAA